MTESLASLSERALEDLRDVFARLPDDAADPLIEAIAAAPHVVVYGCVREGEEHVGREQRARLGVGVIGRRHLDES
jgi:hypothetical protein